jgi:hypothetical protein
MTLVVDELVSTWLKINGTLIRMDERNRLIYEKVDTFCDTLKK